MRGKKYRSSTIMIPRLLKLFKKTRPWYIPVLLLCLFTSASAETVKSYIPDVEYAGMAIDDQDQEPVRNREYVEKLNDEAADLLTSGEVSKARDKINEALRIADLIGDDEGLMFAYGNLGTFYSHQGMPDSVIARLRSPFEKMEHTSRWVNIGNMIASAHRDKREYSEAIRLYLTVLEQAEKDRNMRMIAAIRQNLAGAYDSLGETPLAIEHYMSALDLAEERQDSLVLAVIYDNLGIINSREGNFELAERYHNESLEIAGKMGNLRYMATSYINMGVLYKDMERFEEAIEKYGKALEAGEKLGNIIIPIQVRYNLGVVYNEMGEPEKALEYFRESYEMSVQYGISQGMFYNYSGMGESYKKLEDLALSADYFSRSLEMARTMNNPEFVRTTNQKLYKVHELKGDTALAFRYLQRYSELTDSLSQTEREQALARQEALLNLRIERENRELAEQALASQERTLLITYALLIVIVFALIVALLLYRNKRKMNTRLKEKRAELEKVNLEKDKLLSILAHDLRSPLSDLQSVVFLLQEGELGKEDLDMVLTKVDSKLQQGIGTLTNYLQWAQNQKDGIKPDMKLCSLYDVVNHVFKNSEQLALNKNLSLENNIEPGTGVFADENLLKVILHNLVSNAVKYVDQEGYVRVDAKAEDQLVYVSVSDNGVGIPEQMKQKLFTSFGGSSMGTHGERGTGLGLSICQDFVQLMGGDIRFKSDSHNGTVFTFSLAAATVAKQEEVAG
jgi:two-component system, sensor histidine kinase and response regulator